MATLTSNKVTIPDPTQALDFSVQVQSSRSELTLFQDATGAPYLLVVHLVGANATEKLDFSYLEVGVDDWDTSLSLPLGIVTHTTGNWLLVKH